MAALLGLGEGGEELERRHYLHLVSLTVALHWGGAGKRCVCVFMVCVCVCVCVCGGGVVVCCCVLLCVCVCVQEFIVQSWPK